MCSAQGILDTQNPAQDHSYWVLVLREESSNCARQEHAVGTPKPRNGVESSYTPVCLKPLP